MIAVQLNKNGQYWQARWYDRDGNRHCRGIGSREKLPERAAIAKCREIEREVNAGRTPGHAPILADYCAEYLSDKEYAPGTIELYTLTIKTLVEHFGPGRQIDAITKADARKWRAKINTDTRSEATVCRFTREAKAIFQQAEDDELIARNPFKKLKTTPPLPDKDWQYVNLELLDRVMDAATPSWRLLLALCRLAGLRRGEALRLKWSEIDIQNRILTVKNPQTYQTTKKRTRRVPICPKLHDILFDAYMRSEGSIKVIPRIGYPSCMHRGFQALCRRAGVVPWDKWCHTLRKNCETDWQRKLDVAAFTEFFGHSPQVALNHYTRAEPVDFQKISHPKQAQDSPQSDSRHPEATDI